MSVAVRTATRIQDMDDINVALGAGVDEYALCWDNNTAKFVLRATTGYDHGLLAAASLLDDDHTQYALLAGRAGGQTFYGGTAANDDITIHGTSNATRTTSYVILQPTAGNVGIGTSTPVAKLDVQSGNYAILIGGDNAADTRTDATGKFGRIGCVHYMLAEEPFAVFSGSSSAANNIVDFGGGTSTLNAATIIRFHTAINNTTVTGTERLRITSAGRVGIGTDAPATLLHATLVDATTNAIAAVLTLAKNVTDAGVGAAGLGPSILLKAESSTTVDATQAQIAAVWNDATHATRKADLILSAYDTAEREGLRIRGTGSAAAIGFLGATPSARIAHVADAKTNYAAGDLDTEAEVITAINTTNGTINSILATLESFGFHAAA